MAFVCYNSITINLRFENKKPNSVYLCAGPCSAHRSEEQQRAFQAEVVQQVDSTDAQSEAV